MSGGLSITGRLRLPEDPAFGRVVPKSKIYQYAGASSRLKALFVEQVEKIVHTSILSPKTANLPAKGPVKEIHVLTVVLRTPTVKPDILTAIDRAIPYPTLFILNHGKKIRYAAAYKRPNEADKKKWVISSHFQNDWISEQSQPQNLPVALDLLTLYEQLIKSIASLKCRDGETMEACIARAELLQARLREVSVLEKKVADTQLQYNRRVEINTQLKNLKLEISELNR